MKKIIYGIYDATAAKYTFLGVADSENLLVRDLSIVVNSGDKASFTNFNLSSIIINKT